MFDQCHWINEPQTWRVEDGRLDVTTDANTDFWRETHYGFTRDSGHVFAYRREGGFSASLRIRARYEALYDQAGMMVRIDEKTWIKAGIELSDGMACLGSVLTAGQSDWATGRYAGDPGDFYLRITVDKGVLRLQASGDGRHWPLVRLCPFPEAETYLVGPMCCTPERAGLSVSFSDFKVTDPLGKDLHDLS
ncbi:regulation of enolase 1 [Xaviernesmea oryzae]|uniref:Regulation of enolase 1 n=1 Tax=Xaviernesmea oryzae TaxID=464029 RepID=A0A1Q9B2R8_9HYPH|nr:DUF1349 domain-containing protein [Xaviernesmea oryzae]OLP62300.1 regulation of enolase 1 [Xaviernesmea oryzae]SEL96079.1 hypothetical protein SAMN04487976_1164 [Xaviernesmea oryzae]